MNKTKYLRLMTVQWKHKTNFQTFRITTLQYEKLKTKNRWKTYYILRRVGHTCELHVWIYKGLFIFDLYLFGSSFFSSCTIDYWHSSVCSAEYIKEAIHVHWIAILSKWDYTRYTLHIRHLSNNVFSFHVMIILRESKFG